MKFKGIVFFRNNCKRQTIKTGKKDVKRLKCIHESVISMFFNNMNDTGTECVTCKILTTSPLACQYCPDRTYCSKVCQVIN